VSLSPEHECRKGKIYRLISHADLLVNEGRVREVDDGEVVRYEATR